MDKEEEVLLNVPMYFPPLGPILLEETSNVTIFLELDKSSERALAPASEMLFLFGRIKNY